MNEEALSHWGAGGGAVAPKEKHTLVSLSNEL